MTSSNPPVGAIAFGRSGNSGIITALEADRIVLRCPDGLKRVPLKAIAHWHPPPPDQPNDADFEDALGLIHEIDNSIAAQAVRDALSAVFTAPGDKRRLWDMLTADQRQNLAIK